MIAHKVRLAPSWQSSPRTGKVDRFIVHHMAATWAGGIATLTGSARQVSANWAIGNGNVVMNVPLERRAWTTASPYWDGRAETVEVANSRFGEPWPVSDVDFNNLARLIADWSTRRGVPINDTTVLTHQEVYRRYGQGYATACPGSLQRRKGELLALARKYQAGMTAQPTKNASKPKETFLMALTDEQQKTLLRQVNELTAWKREAESAIAELLRHVRALESRARTLHPELPGSNESAKPKTKTHKVAKGDTLWKLAQTHKTTVEALKKLNPGVDPDALKVGEKLRVK